MATLNNVGRSNPHHGTNTHRLHPQNLVEQRVNQAVGSLSQSVQAKISWAWKATLATSNGQIVAISLIFAAIWGFFGFSLSMQAAALYFVGKLVYSAWKDRGLADIVRDQNHNIEVLQEALRNSDRRVLDQHRINHGQLDEFRQLTENNRQIHTMYTRVLEENEKLQRERQEFEFHQNDFQLQLQGAKEQAAGESRLRKQIEAQMALLEINRSTLQAANNEKEQEKLGRMQAESQLAAAMQQIQLLQTKNRSQDTLKMIRQNIAEIQACSLQSDQGKEKGVGNLLTNLRRLKSETIALIGDQITALPLESPTRLPLLSLKSYLEQENGMLELIQPILPMPQTSGTVSSSVSYLQEVIRTQQNSRTTNQPGAAHASATSD